MYLSRHLVSIVLALKYCDFINIFYSIKNKVISNVLNGYERLIVK